MAIEIRNPSEDELRAPCEADDNAVRRGAEGRGVRASPQDAGPGSASTLHTTGTSRSAQRRRSRSRSPSRAASFGSRRRHLGRRAPEPPAARHPDADDAPSARRPPRARRAAGDPLGLRGRDLRPVRLRDLRADGADGRRPVAVRVSATIPGREARCGSSTWRRPPSSCRRCTSAYRRDVPAPSRARVDWWKAYRLADPEHWRRRFRAEVSARCVEFDGKPVAYVLYRIKSDWEDGFSKSLVKLVETCATSRARNVSSGGSSSASTSSTRIQGRHDPGSPLFLMVVDPRSLQLRVSEGLWLRFVDLGRGTRRAVVRDRRLGRARGTGRRSVRGMPAAGASAGEGRTHGRRRGARAGHCGSRIRVPRRIRLQPACGRRARARARSPARSTRASVLSERRAPRTASRTSDEHRGSAGQGPRRVHRRGHVDRPVLRHGPERGAHAALRATCSPLERMHGAWSNGAIVGGAGAFPFNLTVPGGDLPTAGVSVVGVFPTHRRRGVLRSLMRAQLDDAHERGEPTRSAVGLGGDDLRPLRLRARVVLRRDHAPARVHRVRRSRSSPRERCASSSRRRRRRRSRRCSSASGLQWPGMFSRSDVWWEQREIADPEERRDGAGPKRWVVYERDGSIDGYAVYRHKPGFEAGTTIAELRVVEALGATPTALPRPLGLPARHRLDRDRQSPLCFRPTIRCFCSLATPRRMRYRMGDGLWVRLVDVGAALSGRKYPATGRSSSRSRTSSARGTKGGGS